jgi:sugar (pentulose or hexulose) kinase
MAPKEKVSPKGLGDCTPVARHALQVKFARHLDTLKQNEPEHFAKTVSILLPHDYINFWLSGVKRMEFGDASGMGILNVNTRQWCRELIDYIDPRVHEMLPELGSSRVVHGRSLGWLVQRVAWQGW